MGMTTPTGRIPWYRPTFRRGLFALLGVEACLLLVERCGWVGLVKGSGGREIEILAIVTAWAAVVIAGLAAVIWLLIRGFRRRFQYSLRSLLLLTLLVSVGMSWFATTAQRTKRERKAAQAIQRLGGRIWWDVFFRHQTNFLSEVNYVDFAGEKVTDEALQNLSELKHLLRLNLNNTDVTESQLQYLKGLTQLKWLQLAAPSVRNEAVKELQQALPNCQIDH
jgi:hypothetical protein